MSKPDRITKLEAAKRQLVVATELYFRDSDSAAIHTLVAASYNVIRDLSKRAHLPPMAKDYLLTTISPGKRKEVERWLNSFENFLKHADRDPDETIELSPTLSEAMLEDAWAQFERLGGTLPPAGKTLKLWCGNIKAGAPEAVKGFATEMKRLGKQRFYETVVQWMSVKPTRSGG